MEKPRYRRATVFLLAGLGLAFTCSVGLVVVWSMASQSDSSLWGSVADQVLTWLKVDHTIGKGDHGVGLWVWLVSIGLGLGIGLGAVMSLVAGVLIVMRSANEPKVRHTTSQGVALGKDWGRRGIGEGRRLRGDLSDRWRRHRAGR